MNFETLKHERTEIITFFLSPLEQTRRGDGRWRLIAWGTDEASETMAWESEEAKKEKEAAPFKTL